MAIIALPIFSPFLSMDGTPCQVNDQKSSPAHQPFAPWSSLSFFTITFMDNLSVALAGLSYNPLETAITKVFGHYSDPVGGLNHPSEKKCSSNWIIFPK